MNQLKNRPYFLLLLVAFFMLHGTVENFGFIYLSEVVKISLTILGCVVLFYFIVKLFIKDTLPAALICFFICGWLLFFGAIFNWVHGVRLLQPIYSYTVFVPLMLLIFLLFILLVCRKKFVFNKLCFYLNVLLLIYCVYDLCIIIYKAFPAKNLTTVNQLHFNPSVVKQKPNVYLLLFDEYPGYKSLQDSFAFANDSLYHFLAKKEFKLLPVFSNYNMTFYSMSSMLNMQYIGVPFVPLQNTMDDDQQRLKEIKNARGIQLFKSMGYSFTNYSIFDILDKPSVKGNSFVVSQAKLLTGKIFFNKIIHDLGWHFIYGKYRIPYFTYLYMQENRNNIEIDRLLHTIDYTKNSDKPSFIYAHFNMPHPPIFYDSAGNFLPLPVMFNDTSYTNKQLFLSYLKYANTKIESLLTDICKKDPLSIVILMSDHGYRGYRSYAIDQPFQFNNICAVRFPDKNYLPVKEKWSNVNFLPYLFNAEFNQKIKWLPDSSIFLRDIKLDMGQ